MRLKKRVQIIEVLKEITFPMILFLQLIIIHEFLKPNSRQFLIAEPTLQVIMNKCFVKRLREAFQSKKQRNLGISKNRGEGGGVIEKSKKSQVSVGNSSKLGGGGHK